jgi:dihydroneopterin aldolase
MGTITLKSLTYHGLHGYYKEERREGNRFEVDLHFKLPLNQAGATDELWKTVDYQEAEEIVRKIMEGESVKLIETLATRIGDTIFETFAQVRELEVVVRKLHPPIETECEYAQVRLTWKRS